MMITHIFGIIQYLHRYEKPVSGSAGGRPQSLLKQARLHFCSGSFGSPARIAKAILHPLLK
jgi:hypothetical protein